MRFLLVLFGWFSIIASLLIILVPYLRRRRDLMNTWGFFHVGCINFIGIASIQSGTSLGHSYSSPTDADYVKFVLGGLVFYVVSTVTYTFFHFPQRISTNLFTKWGPRQPKVLSLLVPVALLAMIAATNVPNVQFVGQLLAVASRFGAIFVFAFCVVMVLNRPFNIFLIVVSACVLVVVGLMANAGFGRQDVLSLIIIFPFCWYWVRARYSNSAHVLAVIALSAVGAGVVITGTTLVRGMKMNPEMSALEIALERFKAIPDALKSNMPGDSIFGGDAVEASLATIRLYNGTLPTEPFFTFKYVIATPFPRAWWPEKPAALGYTLPIDIGWSSIHGDVNLGPGIIGHGYHEGGLFFVAFYAFFYAAVMRFMDSLLLRDPGNPYLLGIIGSFSAQIVAFPRGDIGLYTAMFIGGVGAGLFINWLVRVFFGTERFPAFDVVNPNFDPAFSAEQGDYLMPQPHASEMTHRAQ